MWHLHCILKYIALKYINKHLALKSVYLLEKMNIRHYPVIAMLNLYFTCKKFDF